MQGTWRYLRLLIARTGLVLGLLTALRALFMWIYRADFPGLAGVQLVHVFLQGLRFDLATLVLWNAPVILLHVLPLPWRGSILWRRTVFGLFLLLNGLLFLACSIDLAFFGFNHKRITSDLLGQLGAGVRNLPSFMLHYGWVAAVFLLLMVVLARWYPRTPPQRGPWGRWWGQGTACVGALALCVLLGRGGWQYQGLSPAHAADHVDVAFAPLVTNSALTFAYSIAAPQVVVHRYFADEDLDRRMSLPYQIRRDPGDQRRNVVLIIVESLGTEYLASLNHGHGYLPFLDSLAQRSLVFSRAFANAERSNKSMCAILAGIPSFSDDAFMNTAYADNRIEGIGTRMKQNGYATSFFHGGINGEYKFDSFTRAAGFDRYYGRDQYPDPKDYDGHWGIFDEEFLQYFARMLDSEPVPFCSAVFTLSSHDPFPVPGKWKGHFPKGTQEIHESLGYTDMALRRFFATASQSPWFKETLFVITGDHTFLYNVHPPWYMNAAGRFAVPIIFHLPDGSLRGKDTTVAQHLDILPSILDATGFEGTVNCFGRSLFKNDRQAYAAQYLNGQYQLIQGSRLLFFNGQETKGLYNWKTDTLFRKDLSTLEPLVADPLRLHLQALVQRYGEAVQRNQLAAP